MSHARGPATMPGAPPGDSRIDARRAIALLWLCGMALRITILAVPPVIPAIRDEFGLNATQVGILGSIAPALFALVSVAGAFLVARVGVRRAMVGGLAIVAVGSALRGASGNFTTLFATSVLMAAGVAIMQPLMPTAVREWLPDRVGFGTAIYTNGLLIGEIVPVWLTLPYVLPGLGVGWRGGLVFWSLPVVLAAAWVLRAVPSTAPSRAGETGRSWLPDWKKGIVWRLGVLLGCCNAIYFGTNAFVPIYLASRGRADLVAATLTALNLSQIPASFLLLAFARPLERRAWPYLAAAALAITGFAAVIVGDDAWIVAGGGLVGFSAAVVLILGLTLPALLCPPDAVARTAAGMFTVSYGGVVAVAVLGGALWDASGVPALAFAPLVACALLLVGATLVSKQARELR